MIEKTNQLGTKIVASWLKSNGYLRVSLETDSADVIDIVADGSRRRICVHVVVREQNQGVNLPARDEKKLRGYALETVREPWVAVIRTDTSGVLSNDIEWINLNK